MGPEIVHSPPAGVAPVECAERGRWSILNCEEGANWNTWGGVKSSQVHPEEIRLGEMVESPAEAPGGDPEGTA